MPIYEYFCEKCNNQLEVIQKISDEPIEICPNCKAKKLVKKTSKSAFHLKGGGWYKDGYGVKNSDSDSTVKKTTATSTDNTPEKTNTEVSEKTSDKPSEKSSEPAKTDVKAKAS